MKKSFMCSLICHNGIIGGGIYIYEESITYKTNKLTVDKKYNKSIAIFGCDILVFRDITI